MASSEWVVDVTEANFQAQVVDRSKTMPVVVDFWAPWCGPCRTLGPLLERLAAEKKGGFLLAKVNTDENPDLAGAFQVNGIPAVFAIRDGKMVDRFEGVLPEPELRQFLDSLGLAGGEDRAPTPLELEGRDPKAAIAAYRKLLASDPANAEARVGLARTLLAKEGNETEAAELLTPIDSGDHLPEAERLNTIIELRQAPHTDTLLASARAAVAAKPDDAAGYLQLATILAARDQYHEAMDLLLAAAERDKTLGATEVRALMVKIFTVIGSRSPEADDYRRRLQGLLY